MSTYTLRTASPAKTRADAVVVGVHSGDGGPTIAPGGEPVAKAYGRRFAPLLATLDVKGKPGEVVRIPTAGVISSPMLILVGLGSEVTTDGVRRAAGVAARSATNAASVALALPADSPELVRAVTEGHRLGGYTFTTYKKNAKRTAPGDVVVLSPVARRKDAVAAFEEAQLLAEAVATTRDWVNMPPGDFTPQAFAEAVVEAAAPYAKGKGKVTVKVLDDRKLAELGCGGLLGVGGGSAAPPRLVELSYAPRGAKPHLALVGKGITYDSGGLTIKPGSSMGDMKSDMAGAAAVAQAVLVMSQLGLPLQVSAFLPMAENMIGGASMRPGDVLTLYGGTTVEVLNTDAEGRLVLGDALAMATERKPDVILDVATLTGHMVVALGDKLGGVMGDPDIVDRVLTASAAAGEDNWPMPIPEHMDERIHSSKIADLAQHDWIRWGGGLFAAAFLREFTAGIPWGHLDIAGPSFNSGGASGHVTSGGTGVSVTTLVEFARAMAS